MKNDKRRKTIGILGGMGPEATTYFFELVIRNTAAGKDQDHVPVIIRSDPRIPNRTEAILDGRESPLSALIEGGRILRRAGADFIVMPCITAHCFLKDAASRVSIPFLDLIDEARRYAQKTAPGIKRVGLIATTGTIRSGIVKRTFGRSGIDVLVPSEPEQNRVMEAIYGATGIKAGFATGRSRRLILGVARSLIRRGAEAVMAGCTEIPLALRDDDLPVPLIEPMRIGALACIRKAGFRIKKQVLRT